MCRCKGCNDVVKDVMMIHGDGESGASSVQSLHSMAGKTSLQRGPRGCSWLGQQSVDHKSLSIPQPCESIHVQSSESPNPIQAAARTISVGRSRAGTRSKDGPCHVIDSE